jgi:lipopolysaccharide/colanic/teichoic acid biosynthesis glycosyltransferase
MDAYYVRDWSVWLDILLLARTVGSVLMSKDAY